MSTTSPFIKMTFQALDENPDTWGSVLNVSALELLEDAISGTATADVTSADVALEEDAGTDNDPHYRMMIIGIVGTPGSAKNVTCPAISQVYLVANTTTGGQTITFKTTAGTGVTIPADTAIWCYCDGTDIVGAAVDLASNATLAATATNALAVGGDDESVIARLDAQQTWAAGQVVERALIVEDTGSVTPTIDVSNSFYALWDGNYQLAAPSGLPQNGQVFTIVIQQGASGGPYTISFAASTYAFENATAPVLSLGANDIDYLGFEYCTNLVGGARWIGSILKGIG